ncbi:unnamed protein product [Pieris macdunnoughi]|uniref:Uncharacterized protein n=1 Tax=Pieris macdunnoughi TaxID=345717 RepID=A0A821RQW2_9NEOP|nr:unnamed protein product [Pieris macdunnoughi]
MADSTEYSSLFALVDSHLSKTSIRSDKSPKNTFILPSLGNVPNCSTSEGQIKTPLAPRFPTSPFTVGVSESPIKNILAQQVANMLKTKERKQQEDRDQKLVKDMQQFNLIDNSDYVIDLMKAVKTPYKFERQEVKDEEVLSSSSSFESLFELKLTDSVEDTKISDISEVPLPCTSDISYILSKKVCEGQPSTFGKVLTSRLRPVAAPYLHENINRSIKVFDFSTPSPCDIHKQRLRKPTMSSTYTSIIEL